MRIWFCVGCFFLFACGSTPEKPAADLTPSPDMTKHITAADTDNNQARDTVKAVPVVRTTRKPEGVYRLLLPAEGGRKILHTVSFFPGTYRLQEEFLSAGDSTVLTEGTWATTGGYVWLYRDQVVRARYTWKGDTLQYYSPRLKKAYSMEKPVVITTANKMWQTKKQEGILLYGIGTEPFWSVEVTEEDTVVLSMPDWTGPLRSKITTAEKAADSTVYLAAADSLKVVVYARFCSDGMSDFLYRQKVAVSYRGQTYNGCGERLRRAH